MDVNGVGTGSATWWDVVALTSANASANFTTPVLTFRVFMQTAVATSVVTVTFLQGVAAKLSWTPSGQRTAGG
jgi:hypothetical protein